MLIDYNSRVKLFNDMEKIIQNCHQSLHLVLRDIRTIVQNEMDVTDKMFEYTCGCVIRFIVEEHKLLSEININMLIDWFNDLSSVWGSENALDYSFDGVFFTGTLFDMYFKRVSIVQAMKCFERR